MPPEERPLADRHLWQIRAVRDSLWILAALIILALIYSLRAMLAPILIAFALAYVVDPPVRALRRQLGIPRSITALAMLLIVLGGIIAFAIWLVPELTQQTQRLVQRIPAYVEAFAAEHDLALTTNPTQPAQTDTTDTQAERWTHAFFSNTEPGALRRTVVTGVGRLFGFVGNVVATGTYLVVATALILILFVFFTTRYESLANIRNLLPASRREQIWEMLRKVDLAFSGYVRGQFAVAIFTTTGFCVGFWLAGVPYWFVVSLIGGVLSLIPYGQMSGWILAIVLKYLESQTGDVTFSWFGVLIAPSLVYAVTQSMESWVITPLVQGQAVNLHPVTVIVVLLIGASLAGIVGLILAIPLTASARMLYNDVFRPRVEQWVAEH